MDMYTTKAKRPLEKVKISLDMKKADEKGTGLRFNEGKPRYDLVQADAYRDMVKVLTMGAEKYGSNNWTKGMNWTKIIASMKRHIAAIENGEDYDEESGLLHAAHIQCNAHFLNAYYYLYPQGDDRPKKWLNMPKIGLDIDEVLCNWLGAWRERFGIEDVPSSWFFDRNINERFNEMRENGELDKFYLGLKPLIKPTELPFVPHCYITSRPVDTEISMKWLDMHGFPARPVHTVGIEKTKVNVAKEAGVEIFVDDSWDNFVDFHRNGMCCYLFDTPHNRFANVGHFRIKSLKDIPLL